jgi:phage terminase large subunit
LTNKKRYVVLRGGAGSGKSVFCIQKLLIRMLTEEGHRILVIRKIARTLRESVYQEFRNQIRAAGIEDEFQFNKTQLTITCAATKSEAVFMGCDDPEKLKSISGITSVFIEEATDLDLADLNEIDRRLRTIGGPYNQILIAFNPIDIGHWLFNRFYQEDDPDVTLSLTTYKDNPYLPPQYIKTLEDMKARDKNQYRIYALGEWGVSDRNTLFAHSFDMDKHVVEGEIEIMEGVPVYLAFDFNRNPITCIAAQHWESEDTRKIRIIKEFCLKDSSIYDLCSKIRAWVGNYPVIVTGDATGRAKNAISKGLVHYYQVIEDELGILPYQIETPSINPSVSFSRVVLNALFAQQDIQITSLATELVKDLNSVTVDRGGRVEKHKLEKRGRNHLMDCLRYYVSTFHADLVSIPKKIARDYKKAIRFEEQRG